MSASGRPAHGARRFATITTTTAANPSAAHTVETAFSPLPHLDRRLTEQLHDYTVAHPTVAAAMRLVSNTGKPLVWWLVLTPVFFWLASRRLPRPAAFVAVTAIGSSLLNLSIKTAVDRTRPDPSEALVAEPGNSFPSGHTQAAVVGYGVLLLMLLPVIKPPHRPWVITAAVAMVALIGFSRIALGAHYPSDVIGAALIGSAWLLTMTAAFSV